MDRSMLRRILLSVAIVLAIILSYAFIFMWSMPHYESTIVTFPQSLQVVVESLTMSGYGGFTPWESDFMNYFIIWMNIIGVVLVFVAFPAFFLPFLRNAIGKTPPSKAEKNDHLIICEYSPYTEALIRELNSREQDYIIIEQDEDKAIELLSSGFNVMSGDPELEHVLQAASIDMAKAVMVHTTIYKNISIIFSARNLRPDIKIIAILTDQEMTDYYRLAGANITMSPRQLIGKSLAAQVPAVSINDSVEIDNNIELVEIDIEEGSELCNKTIHEANLLDHFHVNIIGAWVKGEFKSPAAVDLTLSSKTRLLVAGDKDELAKLTNRAEARVSQFTRNKVLILGYGQSGRAAAELLRHKSVDVDVVDLKEGEGVDFVGDVRVAETLENAGIENASAIIVTIRDDTAALFATLMARDMNREARIIVRANNVQDIQKLYQAGADYVQSLATVTGRMLASSLFDDETSLAAEKQIDLVQLPAGSLAGQTLVEADVRRQTGCTILAAVRDGEKITALDPNSFTFKNGDDVIIAGTDNSIHQFEEKYL